MDSEFAADDDEEEEEDDEIVNDEFVREDFFFNGRHSDFIRCDSVTSHDIIFQIKQFYSMADSFFGFDPSQAVSDCPQFIGINCDDIEYCIEKCDVNGSIVIMRHWSCR